jgi:hypothetical protein
MDVHPWLKFCAFYAFSAFIGLPSSQRFDAASRRDKLRQSEFVILRIRSNECCFFDKKGWGCSTAPTYLNSRAVGCEERRLN